MPKSIDEMQDPEDRFYAAKQSLIRSVVIRLAMAALLVWVIIHFRLGGWAAAALIFAIIMNLGLLAPAWIVMKNKEKELEGGTDDAASEH